MIFFLAVGVTWPLSFRHVLITRHHGAMMLSAPYRRVSFCLVQRKGDDPACCRRGAFWCRANALDAASFSKRKH